MKIFILITVFLLASIPVYSQIEDIFDKTKEEIEKEIKKEQKEKEKKEKEKKEQEKTEKKKLEEMQQDTACVSDYHRTHKGEIFFAAGQDIDLTKEIGFTDTFGEKDVITACIYMDKRLKSYDLNGKGSNSSKKYYARCYINDAEFDPRFNDRLTSDVTAFTLRLQGTMGILSNSSGYWNRINQLAPGSHKMRIEIWGGDLNMSTSSAIARGEFTFIKDAPPPVVLKRFSDIPAGMSNTKLERDAIDAINRYASSEGWKERYSKATITSYDWYTKRNEFTGIILGRTLSATMLGTWPDGSCKYTEFSVWQGYDGSRYSNVMEYYGIGGMWECECE